MNVSAVNCTPIKPSVSFSANQGDYEKVAGLTDQLTDSYISANDIKTPGQILVSVGAAGVKAFASGIVAATMIASLFKTAPNKLQSVLKTGSNKVKNLASSLSDDAAKHAKIKKPIGKVIGKAEQIARNTYKKLFKPDSRTIVDGMSDDLVKIISDNNEKAFRRIGGAVSAAAIVPNILARDNDDDGVKDIVQKSQSAYCKVDEKNKNLTTNLAAMAELASILS